MERSISVCIREDGAEKRILNAREFTVREKLLTALFGKKCKVILLTPCNSDSEITVTEKRGVKDEKRAMPFDCS